MVQTPSAVNVPQSTYGTLTSFDQVSTCGAAATDGPTVAMSRPAAVRAAAARRLSMGLDLRRSDLNPGAANGEAQVAVAGRGIARRASTGKPCSSAVQTHGTI